MTNITKVATEDNNKALNIADSENLVSNTQDMTRVAAGSNGKELSIADLANLIANKLNDKCIGYEFVISYKENFADMRSWGSARRSQDAPSRLMSIFDQYNIASVTKPITSAALLKLLYKDPTENRDSKMWTFLPSHWTIDETVKVITFRDLLTHTSGFRSDAHSYADLKSMVKQGIKPGDYGQEKYQNCNYTILRLIIPKLAGYSIASIPHGTTNTTLQVMESIQATGFAQDYMDYVQKKLFNPAGLPLLACKPVDNNPALFYQFPKTSAHGDDFGDYTLICGSGGWNMSSAQLSTFFRTLHYTEKIMPESISNLMINEKLGYGTGTTPKGVNYYEKEGLCLGSAVQLNAAIVGFADGIIVTVLMNSQGPALEQTVRDAFDEWYE
jgi:CubicO group peptidase (beta-lactamase class C family)